MARAVVAACLVAIAAACDLGAFVSDPPPASCTRIGAQCQLPDGPLGVCESAPCADAASSPCLVCTEQH
jgi:hypothetical protein